MSAGAGRCPRCWGTPEGCLCAEVVPSPTRVAVVLVQHLLEEAKVSNTGRIVALALPGLERRVYGGQPPALLDDLSTPGTVLLFPGGGPMVPAAEVRRLVVVDASWSQARKMVQRVPSLRALPRLSLATGEATPSLRTPPQGGLSTVQAVAAALRALGDEAPATLLERLHERLLARVWRTRGYL